MVSSAMLKLDAAGHYDDFEVDRVVAVELNPKSKQGDLVAALTPVQDRVVKRYKAAREALKIATEKQQENAAKDAQDELNALVLFKADMGAFLRLYTFLSQIFDYGNTDIEKRAIFYKRLLPLLEFGREREGIDISKVVLTHHHLKNLGKQAMPLNDGETPKLEPITEAGSGSLQDKEKASRASCSSARPGSMLTMGRCASAGRSAPRRARRSSRASISAPWRRMEGWRRWWGLSTRRRRNRPPDRGAQRRVEGPFMRRKIPRLRSG